MSPYNITAPRIGTADTLKPYRRVDSRACFKCGAVAGRCEHLADDTDIIWINRSKERPISVNRAWSPQDREAVVSLYRNGWTQARIADALNTTAGAISGILNRAGVRK